MYTWENLAKDMALIAEITSRISGTISRTTFDDDRQPDEQTKRLAKIEAEVHSLRFEVASLSDNFFSWHNEMLRLARQ